MTSRMIKALALLAAAAIPSSALALTPLWLRDIKISPDGSKIAFTYKGDIFTVPSTGGMATRLTTDPAYETSPIWSPDGNSIAYASDRHGSADLFIIPSRGGEPRRLTSFSAAETPQSFSPDGSLVYFSAAIQDPASSALFPSARLTELYSVPAAGGAISQVLPVPAEMIAFAPDGNSFVYQDVKGMENEWRKHHTSSVTRGLWSYDLRSGRHTPLVDHPGEDRNPVVSPSGADLIFLSERDGGSMNVYTLPLTDLTAAPRPLTSFTSHPVRFLSQAADGTLAFGWDGEIFTLAPGAAEPSKINIEIITDAYEAPDFVNFSSGATEAIPSPNGELLAFSRRGDIFVSSVEYGTTRQITSTPWAESSPGWADGGRSIYFVSNRDGHNDIYRVEMTRDADSDMLHSTSLKEERVLPATPGVERSDLRLSPDGSKLAYVRNRSELVLLDLTTKAETLLAGAELNPERSGLQFSWSPDGNWILYTCIPHHHSPYYDIALVNADGSTPQTTLITETGYFEEMPRFSPDGTAVTWLSERYGMRNHASWGSEYDVMATFLTREAFDRHNLSEEELAAVKKAEKKTDDKDKKADSAPKPIAVDREGLEERTVRLTPYSSALADAILSKDGEKLYYLSKVEKGYDLWKLDLRKGTASIVNKLAMSGSAHFEPMGDNLFLLSPSAMKKMGFANEKFTNISYSGRQKIDRAAERETMLEFVRTEEREKFYTQDMHGVDWDNLVDHYRRFLPHINNYADYAEMLSEMLGELNVSHTGASYRNPARVDETTADLGLIYDLSFRGPGLKIAEVVKGGPLDHSDSAISAGDVIMNINGTEINEQTDFTALLNGLSGKLTLIKGRKASGTPFEQTVKPVNRGRMNDLLYRRWVKRNEEKVDSLSGGRLGYVHIQSMGDPSFRPMYAKVLGKYNDRDGIIIDTRWNGGGRMHEDIEVLFSGRQYLTQKVRGEETARMPSRRWTKPSIMIIGEANYSNAHGTPWVYSKMGLGKLVGMPVPGTMTSVNWVDLQEPTVYFGIPVIGYETEDGSYLENKQLEPDIKIANTPERVAAGIDDQLEAAVRALLTAPAK